MMKITFSHELYKMAHQRSSWLAFIILFGLMIYSAIPIAYINKNLISQGFGSGQWVIIIMIALSANLVAMEFRNNTMATLLYKSPNRQTDANLNDQIQCGRDRHRAVRRLLGCTNFRVCDGCPVRLGQRLGVESI